LVLSYSPQPGTLARLTRACAPSARFCMETEVHVFAFSMAANVLLSFFPFLIVMLSFFRYVLRWKAAGDAIRIMLTDYFPGETGDFLWRNLSVEVDGALPLLSIGLLLFTANGIFEPLEVALNRVWGVKNRSFVHNQAISLGLIFVCGTLALIPMLLTAMSAPAAAQNPLSNLASRLTFKAVAIPLSIVVLMLVYWLLANR
jgi:uncharacterized BrkB/YihY/UPF0761 family membrane protein